jgi:hypothetical protein
MARLNSAYRRNVLLAMLVYVAVVVLVWPLARTTPAVPLKALLALAPVVPMSVALWIIARHIMRSDELQQRVHLVAMSVATGVVSVASLAGGFLCASGVIALDGDVLIWVMPALAFVYGVTHLIVGRRYGGLGCG